MRIIATFDQEDLANRFSKYLSKLKIENSLDKTFDNNKTIFNIWVVEEESISKAENIFQDFLNNPQDLKFDALTEDIPLKEMDKKENVEKEEEIIIQDPLAKRKKYPYKITFFILMLCVGLFFLNFYQAKKIQKKYDLKQLVIFTPIQELFLFDLPKVRLKLNEVIIKYDLDTIKKLDNPPEDAQKEIEKIESMPTFQGLYHIILSKFQKKPTESGVLFQKIKQGQIWRLFTPCLLHAGFLHILFNMLWLWFLGKQMEPRLKFFKYILFILIVGVLSNVVQYLMGGPYFLGFSGVILGMAGFIYIREKAAPWEGYMVPRGVFLFIAVYVLAMFLLQLTSFIFQVFKPSISFNPAIANSAHISGAIFGMMLAKIPYFSWREK
ncbi:MAG: Rhomboid protease GlpG [Candidatus Anoxychlamydiales bacterium]|nr:Rhomboid protease GlpG [Candidatus Anoxychlamydiales bacterium]